MNCLQWCIIPIALFALSTTDIVVNKKNGNDILSCLTGKVPCTTLGFVFSNLPDCHDHPFNVIIHDGNYKFSLNSTVTNSLFQNCPSVSITGSGADKTSVICRDDTGFSFHGLQSIKISSIKFIDCGSYLKSKMIDFASDIGRNKELLLRMSLYFDNCKDVILKNLLLVNNKYTAVVVNNIHGSFLVEELAIFDQNTPSPTGVDVLCCDYGKIEEKCTRNEQRNFSWTGFTNKKGMPILNVSSNYAVGKSGKVLIFSKEHISKDITGADNCKFDDNVLWGDILLVQFKSMYVSNISAGQNLFLTNRKGAEDRKDGMCPPGYYLASNKTCQCSFLNDKEQLNGILSCNNDRHVAKIKRGYWAGYRLSKQHPSPYYSNLVTGQCPRHYCSKMKTVRQTFLPNTTNMTLLNDVVCSPYNRNGTLCGKCIEGFAVAVNSPYYDCVNCSNWLSEYGWIFLIITEYLPSTALFVILLFFNVDLNSGSIASIILYFQVFDSLNIYSDDNIGQLGSSYEMLKGISFLYNIWNLEFFGNFLPLYCISPNFNTMHILLIKYISGIYAFLLFALFAFLSGVVHIQACGVGKVVRKIGICCTRFKLNITRQGPTIRGLATFWTLVIAKLAYISGLILSLEKLKGSKVSKLVVPVAWLQGNMDWGGDEHQIFVIIAILVLSVFVLVPVAGLLFYPLALKITEIMKEKTGFSLKCLDTLFLKIKSFIDSVQGSFKIKYIFFAGLLCCYRLAIIFVFSFTIREETFFYNTVISVIFVIIIVIVQPYKKPLDNIVIMLSISNIILINLISMYLLYYSDTDPDNDYNSRKILLVLQLILVLLPFLYFMIFAVWGLQKKFKAWWNHEPVYSELEAYTGSNAQVQCGSHADNISDDEH